jgi:hypothetical protein
MTRVGFFPVERLLKEGARLPFTTYLVPTRGCKRRRSWNTFYNHYWLVCPPASFGNLLEGAAGDALPRSPGQNPTRVIAYHMTAS